MRNKIIRKLLLFSLILVSFGIFYVIYLAIKSNQDPLKQFLFFAPFTLQILSNLVLAIFLNANYSNNSRIELQIAPLLLFSITLENTKVLNLYSLITYQSILKGSIVNRVYFFAILFSAFTFVGFSIYQQEKSYQKSNQYIMISLLFTLFLSFFGPALDNVEFFITFNYYTIIVVSLYLIAILNFIIYIFRGFTLTKLFKEVFLIALTVGNFLLTIVSTTPYNYTGLIFYTIGQIGLLLLLKRKKAQEIFVWDL